MRINRECIFGPKLPKDGFWGRNFENLTPDSEPAVPRYHVCQFYGKTNNFDFFSPNFPRNEFCCQNFKKLSPNLWNQHLQDTMCANFQANRTTLIFRSKFAQKRIQGWEFRNLRPDPESALSRYHECQISVKTNNFEFFGLNLRKLPNYMRHFGSNNVEGIAEGLQNVYLLNTTSQNCGNVVYFLKKFQGNSVL